MSTGTTGVPSGSGTVTSVKLTAVSVTFFVTGLLVFRRMKPRFYEHI